jgi:hypothetical protein
MMKAADQENFDRKRSREIRGLWSGQASVPEL